MSERVVLGGRGIRGVLGILVALMGVGQMLGCRPKNPLPEDLSIGQQLEAKGGKEVAEHYRSCTQRCTGPSPMPQDTCGVCAFRYAQALEQRLRLDEAVAAYKEVRSLSGDGRLIGRALVRAALILGDHLGRKDEALSLCRQVISRWPEEIPGEDALRLLVRLMRSPKDQEDQLLQELTQLEKDRPTQLISGFALLYRAQIWNDRGQIQQAVADYDEIWRRFPRGPLRDDAAYRAAVLLRKAGLFEEAVKRLSALQKTFVSSIIVGHYNSPNLDEGALLLGEIYLSDLHEPDRAIESLVGFRKRQPDSPLADDALLLIAQAAAEKKDHIQACKSLAELIATYPHGSTLRRGRSLAESLSCPVRRP